MSRFETKFAELAAKKKGLLYLSLHYAIQHLIALLRLFVL